ncbi:MAG: S8 family serine peptidase [Candidatus Poseidoniaceae archaeon]|nr:S8 family serine peptidase [Candidatus Poseidoniaceae archaeon]
MRKALLICLLMLTVPITGSISNTSYPPHELIKDGAQGQLLRAQDQLTIPSQTPRINSADNNLEPWWEYTTLDRNRDRIHDSILSETGIIGIGLSYNHSPNEDDLNRLAALGLVPVDIIESVDAVLLGKIPASLAITLAQLEGVVMVERYGEVVFWGDIQTMAVKARNSSVYNDSAWQLGVSGAGINIAMVDTGVDNEHPALEGKFVAGYDAVCYMHSDPQCLLAGGRQDDGSFDPDDGNQHGTACMGMASSTGLEADGSQSEFYGSAPNASLIDVRIGTDVGAGPFENYLLEQEFYESAMNGIQWIIDNKDTAWGGADETLHGIDIISLSWGITSHEAGGSDGNDMHSRILDTATEAGIVVSVAAGNDGPDNDGFSGMGSSSLSITVGATDDINTVDRVDDTVASYSSRGPRRDNGDGNPLNELKPDISAPGTNIIQSEGCVTSGGCNNNIPGQDASDNTYTGRGSGTSYATPAISGIVALMLEANPQMDPLTVREVLRQTAERKGGATLPDVDPYWNKDFGWGMVDARAAVELSLQLNASNINISDIDVTLQNHLLNVTVVGDIVTITGHAWSQTGIVDAVQFRIGNGTWNNVTYETPLEELEAGQPFNWTVVLDLSQVEAGNQTIEVRTLGSAGHSLPVTISVIGKSTGLELGGGDKVLFIVALTLLVIVAGGFAYRSSIEEGVQFSRGVREDAAVSKSTTDAGKDASSNEKTYGAGNGEVLEADLA